MVKEAKDFLNLGVVINEQGEVLLIKRVKQEKGRDESVLTWAFPGGKQRLNESRQECVAREILDETGYKVESTKGNFTQVSSPISSIYYLPSLQISYTKTCGKTKRTPRNS